MQWRASMELAQGQHQLLVAAAHPSGMFTAWATNSFTNTLANETVSDSFDGAGNVTTRVWTSPSGAVERTQTLSWDARGRLHAVTERDTNTNGYNWTAIYDGLGRRLSTTSVLVTNGVAYTAPPTIINSLFDPQVEFLELGVSYGKTTEWKLYGPDLNGVYGGANGTGGFDAVSPYLSLFEPVISDFRGNVLGVVTNGVVSWNPARPTGYGAVPGYRPMALGSGASVSLSSAWRGHWADITGYHGVGARTYDPVSGRWLSFDPAWNGQDPNGFSMSGGDPINSFDHDGRLSRNDYANTGVNQPDPWLVAMFGRQPDQVLHNYWGGNSDDPYSTVYYWSGGLPIYSSSANSSSIVATIGNSMLNTDARNAAWDELSHPDFSSGWGIATWADAGVSYAANTADMAANMIPIVGGVKSVAETAVKTVVKDVVKTFTEDAAKSELRIASYDILKNDESVIGQAHHLNQNAAYRDVIPQGEGVATGLEGNAFTDVGTPHYNAHESMESFWNDFRESGQLPTNLQYTQALANSLRAAGLSEAEVQQAVQAAIQQRVQYGLLGGMPVPRLPGRINQVAR
jgi:RHS repeat-associated protein